MKKAICKLKSVSPYSQSKYLTIPKKSKELNPDYEDRVWRERFHYDANGIVFIPATQFSNSLKAAAKYLAIQIPGKGKSLYSKHFEAGVMVTENLPLNINVDNIEKETFFVPSDGRRGGTTRVAKHFGIIREWSGTVEYFMFDDIITEDIFERVLKASGQLIGIGRFRPINWGWYGRFEVQEIKFIEFE